jgi:predicted P-loop ATPase
MRQDQQDEGPQDEADRQKSLLDWGDKVLDQTGVRQAIADATTIEELQRITFDPDSTAVVLAINDALHPPKGQKRQRHFDGLSAAALKKIVRNRLADLKKDRQKQLLGGGGDPSDDATVNWTDEVIFDKSGNIIGNVHNMMVMFRHHPEWAGVLSYSEFTGLIVIKQQPPWGSEEPDASWTDQHTTKTCAWFVRNGMNRPSRDNVIKSVEVVAREHSFHPVKDYFEALRWDGVPRLERWLLDYLMVDDTPYVRAIAPRFLISAVARIYSPGAKVDHILVLEGPQGRKKKSQTVEALAPKPEWSTDNLSHVASKDAKLEVTGVLLVEIPEMEAIIRATSSAMKKFITHRSDRFRPPYGRHVITWPRQCVFVGTINPIPGEGYLKDPTGARRIWPVMCGKETDLEGIKRDRDQLWAEAVHQYKASVPWWLETPELEALATAEQEARFARDDWELPIREWLGD